MIDEAEADCVVIEVIAALVEFVFEGNVCITEERIG
mgnify:CR=1 FL=1